MRVIRMPDKVRAYLRRRSCLSAKEINARLPPRSTDSPKRLPAAVSGRSVRRTPIIGIATATRLASTSDFRSLPMKSRQRTAPGCRPAGP